MPSRPARRKRLDLVVMRADGHATGNGRHSFSLRVPPRYCDAQGMVHAVRYYELFEEAFLSWLEHACGGYLALQFLLHRLPRASGRA
jgi:hypothetical protein